MKLQTKSKLNFNWKELHWLAQSILPELKGLKLHRLFIPTRSEHPNGFLKSEFCFEFKNRRNASEKSQFLILSYRAQCPYFYVSSTPLKPNSLASRSAFEQFCAKELDGAIFEGFDLEPNDRGIYFRFTLLERKLSLYFKTIPAHPILQLYEIDTNGGLPQILRSATTSNLTQDKPKSSREFTIREELTSSNSSPQQTLFKMIQESLNQEILLTRIQKISSSLSTQNQLLSQKLSSTQKTLKEAQNEPEWKTFGDDLSMQLYQKPKIILKDKKYFLPLTKLDESNYLAPADPKLTLHQQLDRYYFNEKRKQKRIQEASLRIEEYQSQLNKLSQLESELEANVKSLHADQIKALEVKLNPSKDSNLQSKPLHKTFKNWSGRIFYSQEDLPILIGRSKDENAELTFKLSHGNDLWFHVKGKPGAHAVILLRTKKNASLDTLLDAAHLCLYYSGGEHWGSTEVDYTQRKYVKRIPKSSEASYTHPKTLIIQFDSKRFERLTKS